MSSSKKEKVVEIQKRLRINNNTTHDSVVDMHIKSASLWKVDKQKHIYTIILYIFSFGLLYISTFIWPHLYIFLSCVPSDIDDAEYVEITDTANNKGVCVLLNEQSPFSPVDIIENINSNKNKISPNNSITNRSAYSQRHNENENDNILDKTERKQSINDDDIIQQRIINSPYYFREEIVLSTERERRNKNKSLIQRKQKLDSIKSFEYLSNKYRYDQNEGMFIPVTFYVNRYTNNELIKLKDGIYDEDIFAFLQRTYPKNEITLKNQGFFTTLYTEIKTPHYIYIFLSMIIWLFNSYGLFSLVILCFTLTLILQSTLSKVDASKRIVNSDPDSYTKVRRPFLHSFNSPHSVPFSSVVPGDSIILERIDPNDTIKVPCDGVILEGYCTVNESDLTGENTLVFRREISKNDEMFSYQYEKKSFLFQGTTISSLYSSKEKKSSIVLLAINTGYNTYRGNMVKNWEYQNPKKKISCDTIILGVIILFIWILAGVLHIVFYKEKYDEETWESIKIKTSEKIKMCIDNITVVFPPTLTICLNFGRAFIYKRLKCKNVSCVLDNKIDTAGLIDVIVLDKTGTLTESNLGIHCYKSTYVNRKAELYIGEDELTPKVLNKIYKFFWQRIYQEKLKCYLAKKEFNTSYQISKEFNMIYFTECLATCNYINRINHQNYGNSLDQKLFEEINWEISQEGEDINSEVSVQPHNGYKITQSLIFGAKREENFETYFCLKYLLRTEFSSQSQSMTVVIQNSIDRSIRAYTKGAPEKIKAMCNESSIPVDLDVQLKNYTSKGFRVLACASKILKRFNESNFNTETMNNGMTFLGLIVFHNQIKRDTQVYINNLQRAKCKLIIATGDNVLTTTSVGQQCDILHYDDEIYNLELSDKKENSLMLTRISFEDSTLNSINKSKSDDSSSANNHIREEVLYEDVNLNAFQGEISMITNRNKAILCCSGSALSIVEKRCREANKQYANLLERLILIKGKIFHRMLPDNKSSLINFFKKDGKTIVSMCGDGANDCVAFMTSDVGVAIKQHEGNTITSHFFYKKESIGCLEDIIKNGRAYVENKILIIKFMILYSCIQITSVLFTIVNQQEMNTLQYIFMDCFCVLLPILISSKTMANDQLTGRKPPKSIFNKNFLFSVVGQAILQISAQIWFGFFIMKRTLDKEIDKIPRDKMHVLSTYVYLFSVFQYLLMLLVFNLNSIHRKPFYSNRMFIFYYSVILLVCVCLIGIKEVNGFRGVDLVLFEDDGMNFEKRLEENKAFTIIWLIILYIVSICYEMLVFKVFKNEEE